LYHPIVMGEAFLGDVLDFDRLGRLIESGYVNIQESDGITVYKYSAKAQYDEVWTRETLTCRGLIADHKGRILARPFPKFFNPYERSAPPVPQGDAPVSVTEKLDGSLGIGYQHPSQGWRVSTVGSPVSPQAREATLIWWEKYADVSFGNTVTPLFEIIYPRNRIVVDYGPTRDLVLLAAIDIESGADLPLESFDWPGPTVQRVPMESLAEAETHLLASDGQGEGYVVRYDTGPGGPHLRFKLKHPWYVETHRIVTGLTPRRVWATVAVRDCHARGVTPKGIASGLRLSPQQVEAALNPSRDALMLVPEEFQQWVDNLTDELAGRAEKLIVLCRQLVAQAREEAGETGGARWANIIKTLARRHQVNPGALFALSRRNPSGYCAIWKQLEPPGDTPAYFHGGGG